MPNGKEVEAEVPENGADTSAEAQSDARGRSKWPYPYFNLEESIEFAKAVSKAGGYGPTPAPDVMKELGVTVTTTRKWTYGLSAAREFALVDRLGERGEEQKLQVTGLFKRILLPEGELDAKRARMEALIKPRLYSRLLERYKGAPVPSETGVSNVLVREYELLPSVAPVAAKAFLDSVKQAGALHNGTVVLDPRVAPPPPKDGVDDGKGEHFSPPPPPPGTQTIAVPKDFIVHQFPLSRQVLVTVPLPPHLTQKDVARLSKWLETLPLEDEDREI